MSEFFKTEEVIAWNFSGVLLMSALTRMNDDEDCSYTVDHGPDKHGVNVELRIDGHEISMRDFLARLEEQWDYQVTTEAMRISKSRCGDLHDKLYKFGEAIDKHIHDKFPEIPQDDD